MTLTPIQDFLQANMQYNENYSYCRLNAKELGTYNGFDKTILRDRTDHWVYTFNRMQGTYYRYLLYKETDNIDSNMFKPCDYKNDTIPLNNTWGGTGSLTATTLNFSNYYNDIKIVTDFNYKDFCMLPVFRLFNGTNEVTRQIGPVLFDVNNNAYTDYAHFRFHRENRHDFTSFYMYLVIYKSDNGNLRTRQKYFVACSYSGKVNNIDKPFPKNSYSNVITGLWNTSDLWTGSSDGAEGSQGGVIATRNAYCNKSDSESDFESGADPAILEVPIYEFNCENGRMKTDTIDIVKKNLANYGLMWAETVAKAIHYGIDDLLQTH